MTITVFHSPVTFYFISIILCFLFFHGSNGATITLVNRCSFTVWPGILSNSGSGNIGSTGFELISGGSRSFTAPASWSGRFWARTGCSFASDTGQFTCLTGDCGSNQVECNGAGAKPPATLAEFTIGSGPEDPTRKQDFYDVSLVDGYNVPMVVEASGGSEGTCLTTGCVTDLNQKCPAELRFGSGSGSACKSACEAFGSPEYCCSGAYASPTECKPSTYSEIFKSACPKSYSFAFDDPTSTFTCTGADYTITLCPSLPSQKSAANGWREGGGLGERPSSPLSSWLSDVFTSHSSEIHESSQYLVIFSILFFLFEHFDIFLIFGCMFCILLHLYVS